LQRLTATEIAKGTLQSHWLWDIVDFRQQSPEYEPDSADNSLKTSEPLSLPPQQSLSQ
jgi:hypothetical protein